MPTWTALTTLPDRDKAEALGEAMERLTPAPTGVGVFEIEDGSMTWEVGGYFTEAPDEARLALLSAAFGAADFAVSKLPETDWVAKVRRDLAPVKAGRFFVYGSHDSDQVPENTVNLLIEAAMAFGTGHHGTTLGCLRALDRLADTESFETIADIGCGTAVLAMAAKRIYPNATVIASDIDQVAVEVATANLAANDMIGQIAVYEAKGFDHFALKGPFDLIFANILMHPLIDLAPSMAKASAPGGVAILSGILTHQSETVAEVYAQNSYDLVRREDIVDWTTLTLRHSPRS